jgi:hypothetical protein
MKINIKNLKGEVFSVEIDPSQTVPPLPFRSPTSRRRSARRRATRSTRRRSSSRARPPPTTKRSKNWH